jgi:hypothetical protein
MQMGKRKKGAAHLAPAALSTAMIAGGASLSLAFAPAISKGVPAGQTSARLWIIIFNFETTGKQTNNKRNTPGKSTWTIC